MGKIYIQEDFSKKKATFLRGILTRSLQDAGLSFGTAYRLASEIRQNLTQDKDVTLSSKELLDYTEQHLRDNYSDELADSYKSSAVPMLATIYIRGDDNRLTAFSRSQHQHCLEPCGLTFEKAAAITAKVHDYLLRLEDKEIPSQTIIDITYQFLEQDDSKRSAQRYLSWTEFIRSNRPLILLIGGTAGSGKSTVATQLAHRLDIVRIQSTDMLREVMRMMIPERLLPALHGSSFNAWKKLPQYQHLGDSEPDNDYYLINGYRTQADHLSVAIEATVQRALHERVSLIVEGVHVHPALLDKIVPDKEAVIVPVMLAALKSDELKIRLAGRGKEAPGRRSKRYLKNFDAIWRLQTSLLVDADQSPFYIIPNDNMEKAVQQIIHIIIDELMARNEVLAQEQ